MNRPLGPARAAIEAAALARIEELAMAFGTKDRRDEMTVEEKGTTAPAAGDADRELKAATRAAWALGDYHAFAKGTVWELGRSW